MKNLIKAFLSFSKKELNGLLVLCVICTLILATPYVLPLLEKPRDYNDAAFQREIAAFRASSSPRTYSNYETYSKKSDKAKKAELFNFDPNGLPVAEWQRLGLSERQIRVIKNYEAKGGRFFRKEDLRKIYSIPEQQYNRLEPYIYIKNETGRHKPYPTKTYSSFLKSPPGKTSPVIELNSADSAGLVALKGIGPAFASRIIKYRNRLGGFHRKEQLREVYGLDSAKYESLQAFVRVDAAAVRKININMVNAEELKKLPYLSYRQINAIIQYRRQHGNYQSPDDLRKISILGEGILRKIEPYLIF